MSDDPTVCEAFFDHVEGQTLPAGASSRGGLEMGTLPGRVRERVAAFQTEFLELLESFAAAAVEREELPADEDPELLAFELNGILLAANARFVLGDGASGLGVARAAPAPTPRPAPGTPTKDPSGATTEGVRTVA